MTTLKPVAIALTIASFVGARPCAAQRLAYADALARASANTSTPSGHEYEATKFAPYHQEHDAKVLQICFARVPNPDRKSTRLNSSHQIISYAVFCLKKKKKKTNKKEH